MTFIHPYLLLVNRGTLQGAAGATAGGNRTRRSALRAFQLIGGASWVWLAASVVARRPKAPPIALILGTTAAKSGLFRRYVRDLRFGLTLLVRRAGRTIA